MKNLEELAAELAVAEEELQEKFREFQGRIASLLPEQRWDERDESFYFSRYKNGSCLLCDITGRFRHLTFDGWITVELDVDFIKEFAREASEFLIGLCEQFSELLAETKTATAAL